MALSSRALLCCIATILAVQPGAISAAKTSQLSEGSTCSTVEEALTAHPQLSNFTSALKQANLTGKLSNPALNVTVFAPSNGAMMKLPELNGLQINKAHNASWVVAILLNHMLAFKIGAPTWIPVEYETLAGQALAVKIPPGNTSGLMMATANWNESALSLAKIPACQAIVYIIDRVLMPLNFSKPVNITPLLANATANPITLNTTAAKPAGPANITLPGGDATGALPTIPRPLLSGPAEDAPRQAVLGQKRKGWKKSFWGKIKPLRDAVNIATSIWTQDSAAVAAQTSSTSFAGAAESVAPTSADLRLQTTNDSKQPHKLPPASTKQMPTPAAALPSTAKANVTNLIAPQSTSAGVSKTNVNKGLTTTASTLPASGNTHKSKTPSGMVEDARKKVLEQVKATGGKSEWQTSHSGIKDKQHHSHKDHKGHFTRKHETS